MVYYNENDKFVAGWLRALMEADAIPKGEVDERSIVEVAASDLRGFAQCHFFAGIGVWAYALRGAGWPEDKPVWTGSCPCQPFSVAGKRSGASDGRHLWPEWCRLIRECAPGTIFGEQVASDDGLAWLDLVSSDLENAGYACGAVDICAAGFGAPHIRQRLYFVAESRCEQWGLSVRRKSKADFETRGSEQIGDESRRLGPRSGGSVAAPSESGELGNASSGQFSEQKREEKGRTRDSEISFWADAEWIPCRDSTYRPVEPGTFPLAHGIAGRVGRLRGYGNALCAPQAIAFIRAYLQIKKGGSRVTPAPPPK